ncbi:MAG: hypothetical protein KDA60_12530 [Planctomycetales bacterium]|nr:hypothetical protein [Planctomycetales bacterium]
MTCVHLKRLYQLCQDESLKFSGDDLVRIVCTQCEREEVCPSVLMNEYDSKHPEGEHGEQNADHPAT